MPIQTAGSVRALALVGPTSGGKTTLMEALLQVTGAVDRRVGGEKVGDSSPEARARGHSVELNLAGFDFMGDRYSVIDCPGSLEFCADLDAALPAVDLAVVVAEPDPAKAALLQPTLRELERLGVPHALFVNKMDQARGSLPDLLAALAPVSSAPAGRPPDPDLGGREGHRLHRPGAGARLRLPAGRALDPGGHPRRPARRRGRGALPHAGADRRLRRRAAGAAALRRRPRAATRCSPTWCAR